jgi:deoxycytidylate deaminase
MRIAAAVAEKSKDPYTKVGAVIVDEDHTVRAGRSAKWMNVGACFPWID